MHSWFGGFLHVALIKRVTEQFAPGISLRGLHGFKRLFFLFIGQGGIVADALPFLLGRATDFVERQNLVRRRAGLLRGRIHLAIERVLQQFILLVIIGSKHLLHALIPLLLQLLTTGRDRGVVRVGQKLKLLVDGVGQAKQRAELVGRVGQSVQFSAQRAGMAGVSQQILLELFRVERLRQFGAGLFSHPGQFCRVRLLALFLQRVQISLSPFRRPAFNVANGVFGLGRKRTEKGPVERRTVGMSGIGIVTGLPIGA